MHGDLVLHYIIMRLTENHAIISDTVRSQVMSTFECSLTAIYLWKGNSNLCPKRVYQRQRS